MWPAALKLIAVLLASSWGLMPVSSSAQAVASSANWEDFARIRRESPRDSAAATTAHPAAESADDDLATRAARAAAEPEAVPPQAPAAGPVSPDRARPPQPAQPLPPIVYTRVPRTLGPHQVELRDGSAYTLHSPDVWDTLPDSARVFDDFNAPGQLVLRQSDGSEHILYDCVTAQQPCVPLDPAVSFDGQRILFAVYRGARLAPAVWNGTTLPNQRLSAATEARLYVVDIATRAVTALAHTPGVFDVSPAWLPDGRIMFASTRANIHEPWLDRITPHSRKNPQLYRADADGSNAINITPHEVTTAMHPLVLQSGRVAYSSQWLSHNLAYGTTNGGINWPGTLANMWLIMDMDTRGGDMTALLGAHRHAIKSATGRTKTMKALHFLGQRRNGDICVSNYYRANNLGLGDIICWQPEPTGIEGSGPGFLPRHIYDVASWAQSNDEPSFRKGDIYQGKVGYPEGLDDGQLLLTAGRGFCTNVSGTIQSFQERVANQPDQRGCDVGLYRTRVIPSRSLHDLSPVVDAPDWHEFGARVVAARTVATPPPLTTGDGSCQLASSDAGTAETSPMTPYHFNDNYKTAANNGGEIDGLPHTELAAIRFWEVLPNTDHTRTFKNSIGNPLRWLGDAPLLADNSFKVSLPCDTPYLMAGVDRHGRVIKRDQVPQSLRPGEKRVCTGCHLHSRAGRPYAESLAFAAAPLPLLTAQPVPGYEQDIKPILAQHCQSCHQHDLPLMDYNRLVWDPFQKAVPAPLRLQLSDSDKEQRRFGLHRPYSSKYVNTMFARESLLYWKAANQRSDGRTDDTYSNDIDFGKDHPVAISPEQLKILAEWLDAGAPQ